MISFRETAAEAAPTTLPRTSRLRILRQRFRVPLVPLDRFELPRAMELATRCYRGKLIVPCIKTFSVHMTARNQRVDDGRSFYGIYNSGSLVAVGGLHFYEWGPADVCWLSWFFVDPSRRAVAPISLLCGLLEVARERGCRKVYVETPSADPEYSNVEPLLRRVDFLCEARLKDYYEPGVDLLILGFDLSNL